MCRPPDHRKRGAIYAGGASTSAAGGSCGSWSLRVRGVKNGDQGPCVRAGCARSRCRRPPRGRRLYGTPRRTGDSRVGCHRRLARGWAFRPGREIAGRVGSVGVALPPPPVALGAPTDGLEILPCRPRELEPRHQCPSSASNSARMSPRA